jgi:hypothetical protein
MFTLGLTAVGAYALGSTAATPLPGSPYTLDLTLVPSPGGNTPMTMALVGDYLYILCSRPGGVSDSYLAYSVSSSGLTLADSGGVLSPGGYDPFTVAMIPNGENIYFVSARDTGSNSTIEPGASYLDIAQASNGTLSGTSTYSLDNCEAQSANLDVTTAQILVSCAPGTGTPTALLIPIASPSAYVPINIPAPTSGTAGLSLLVDGYLYVLVNATDPAGDGIEFFQSFSVSSSGAVTFIQQYSLGDFGPGAGVVSIAAGDGYLFYSATAPQTLGEAGAVQIFAGNMTASAVSASYIPPPDGSIFFDVPSAMLLSNFEYRAEGTLVMPLGTPGIYYTVGAGPDSDTVGLAVVGN